MMKFLLFAAIAASLAAAQAQTPAAPALSMDAAADPDLVEPDVEPPKTNAQLLETGGFERPRVETRTPKEQGGNPIRTAKQEWLRFDPPRIPAGGGKLNAGLTNEIARTGKQSIFLEFDKVTAEQAYVELDSELVSIRPAKSYRVSIWGRLNKKSPLTIDQRIPFLRLQVDFFTADRETATGETIFKVQPMPGSRNRPPLFLAGKWNAFYAEVESPEDAAFMKITWSWGTPPEKGVTSGIIYFDDATIEGPPGKTEEEIMAETPDTEDPLPEDAAARDAAPVTAPAPSTTPKPLPLRKR